MTLLRDLFNQLTYRTTGRDPEPVHGLRIVNHPGGGRTVYDPRVSSYLEARRRKVLTEGPDGIDYVLMDADTLALLRATAARMNSDAARSDSGLVFADS